MASTMDLMAAVPTSEPQAQTHSPHLSDIDGEMTTSRSVLARMSRTSPIEIHRLQHSTSGCFTGFSRSVQLVDASGM